MYKHTLGAAALSLLFNSNAVQASPVPETSPATGHLFKRVAQISPQYPMFTVPLPIPPVKQPRL
jgi:hypothetical protein